MQAFLLVLVTLTGVLWMTQALKEMDLLTSKGQAILLFLSFTALSMPGILLIIAPVAFFIAVVHVLNRLNKDSELVIIGASGASHYAVMRPVLRAAILITLGLYLASLYLVPASWRELRSLITDVRADVIAKIVKEGEFSSPEPGLVFHVRQRDANGTLRGLIVNDERDPARAFTYLAERARVVEAGETAALIMEAGSVQQFRPEEGGAAGTSARPAADEINIVVFDRYIFDLSSLAVGGNTPSLKPRERSMEDLLYPEPDDPRYLHAPGQFTSELNERLAGPLYPIVFALIALATVGAPRTMRQRRNWTVLAAIVAVLGVRLAGFGLMNLSAAVPAATVGVFAVPIGAALLAFLGAAGRLGLPWEKLRAPRFVARLLQRPRSRPSAAG